MPRGKRTLVVNPEEDSEKIPEGSTDKKSKRVLTRGRFKKDSSKQSINKTVEPVGSDKNRKRKSAKQTPTVDKPEKTEGKRTRKAVDNVNEIKTELKEEVKTEVSDDIEKTPVNNTQKISKPKRLPKQVKSRKPIAKNETKTEPEADKPVSTSQGGKKDSHSCEKFVGAHVSISGGLYKAVDEAVEMGAKAFGLFLKSQRQWNSKPLQDKDAEKFKTAYQSHGFSPDVILPHGSYLMNCGSPNSETLQKSRDLLTDELQRCEKLGLTLFNFHPGSTCGDISREECMSLIAESINIAHSQTKYVTAVIENMSCQGNTVGGKFEELKGIIEKVKDKSRIGVCLDTCHAFAAGYDLSTAAGFKNMMEEFGTIVGFEYLKALHINDSKGHVGCHLDRHENIGRGRIGKEGFRRVMQDKRLDKLPMILETPFVNDDTYSKEIKLLHTFCTDS